MFTHRLLPLRHYKIASITGGVKQVAAGGDHTVLLVEDGTVMTFGRGSYGKLGHVVSCDDGKLCESTNADLNVPKTVRLVERRTRLVGSWPARARRHC